MKIYLNKELPKPTHPAPTLNKVLDRSAHVKGLVEECAEELSSVNTVLHQELAGRDTISELAGALEKSEAVETKVQDASEELSLVNKALEHEVRERQVLEHELIAAKEQEEAARHAAFHDPLTGLPNRVLFNDRLEHGLAQAQRHGRTLAVMFVDLDDFKNINDVHGHDMGDKVLRIIAARLKENTRDDDTVSRHGGDEFLYLLMEIGNEQDVAMIAEKIIKAIQAPCGPAVGDLVIKPSIGIAIFPKDGTTADTLVKSADKAMYRAKQDKCGYAFAA
jgi:diguanylate cyclase